MPGSQPPAVGSGRRCSCGVIAACCLERDQAIGARSSGPILLNSPAPGWIATPPPAACSAWLKLLACGSPGHTILGL